MITKEEMLIIKKLICTQIILRDVSRFSWIRLIRTSWMLDFVKMIRIPEGRRSSNLILDVGTLTKTEKCG